MEEIRAYLMGSDGHIAHRIDLVCADEKEARLSNDEVAPQDGAISGGNERSVCDPAGRMAR